MAVNPQQELIWQGRTHLGDEPGVFGDSQYGGLCTELPITVRRLDPQNPVDAPFKIVLETENLETFGGYPGHHIVVLLYVPDPANPFHYIEKVLARDVFTSADMNRKELTIRVDPTSGPFFISIRLRVDVTVPPGLYDDFVWIRLSLISEGSAFFASLGFISL